MQTCLTVVDSDCPND